MSGDTATVGVLKPGQRIKPNVSDDLAKQLIHQHYGCQVTKIKELNGYDDSNYYIEAVNANGNNQKFIFKVLNSMDSRKTWHVELENACMLYLSLERGINCPLPQKDLKGETFSVISIPDSTTSNGSVSHAIRLLQFVEGKLLADVPVTQKLLYEAGAYISLLGNYLKGFTHPGLSELKNHQSMWLLSSVPNLLQFAYVFQDQPAKLKVVHEVVSEFKARVESAYPKLEKVKSLIHGDLNEQNMLVCEVEEANDSGKKQYGIHGIIDFGDIQETFPLFELSISLTYLMLQCVGTEIDPIQGGAYIIEGYCKYRKIPKIEFDVLRTCIAGRLCQSIVMGAYTYSQDPGNEYLLTTAKTGWELLQRVWNDTTDDQLKKIWNV